jgi:hypothetical protein
MQQYKRNQVEEAIEASMRHGEADPSADLRVRIKRLLDVDRTTARAAADRDCAFYSGKAPGSGTEVWFSAYEAFSLLLGLLLLQHQWPQGTVVRIMRQARPKLEPEHARILAEDPAALFDAVEIAAQAAPGAMAVDSADAVFLAIVTTGRSEAARADIGPHAVSVCRGRAKLMTFMRERALVGLSSMTSLEVTSPAHLLAHHLHQTSPRARGRQGR